MLHSALLCLLPLGGGDVFEGNGQGQAFIESTNAILGGALNMRLGTGDPNHTGGVILSVSDGFGPTVSASPLLDLVALDTESAGYFVLGLPLDPNDEATLSIPVANDPALLNFGPLYATAFTLESGIASHSKTVRVAWVASDSTSELDADLFEPRLLQTATPLGDSPADNRHKVLIAGGATGSIILPTPTAATSIFQPAQYAFEPGPEMSAPRSGHTATKLADGRVLIAGGVSSDGVVLGTCEIYWPDGNVMTLTNPMSTARVSHAATLLDDGRVLVSGGFSEWVAGFVTELAFVGALNTSQRTVELFDPVIEEWTTLAGGMSVDRSGHTQTLLADGRVLLVGGVFAGTQSCSSTVQCGGAFPLLAPRVEVFDPATGVISISGPLYPARAFHGASVVAGGDVLVTGGIVGQGVSGSSVATADCARWNGATWSSVAPLAGTAAFHTQVATPDGRALVVGGYVDGLQTLAATDRVGVHDGSAYAPRSPLGDGSAARGAHTCTRLSDGTYLLLGGSSAGITLQDGKVYVP